MSLVFYMYMFQSILNFFCFFWLEKLFIFMDGGYIETFSQGHLRFQILRPTDLMSLSR